VSINPQMPTATTRWRCSRCGNLTRFDVTRSTRAREYVHLDLAGEPEWNGRINLRGLAQLPVAVD